MTSLHQRHADAAHRAHHWISRIEAELAVTERLTRLHPEHAEAWLALAREARSIVEPAATKGSPFELEEAVRRAESVLDPVGEVAKTYAVHCVGHAHIDMNWMWSWPETVAVVNDTFTTVLRLMEEYPDFKFSQSQASIYRIVEQHHPKMLSKIAELVGLGRWEVTASHWVECDKNIVSGESLCRQLLYTRDYMHRLFGLSPEDVAIDWAPDTFGHAATVPGYLVRGGIRYVYLHRPGVHTREKPEAFVWEGLDGSRVLVRNDMRLGYNGSIGPHVAEHAFDFAAALGCRSFMFVYGVGDHGGGPTRRDLERILDMGQWPVFPALRFSTAQAFYKDLEKHKDLPVVHGELNTEFTGCFTSQSLIKKANRTSENRLLDAELAASLSWAVEGEPYPQTELTEAWRDTLFSQFHDILPGSGVHDTRTHTHGLYQRIVATTAMVETLALRSLAQRIATRISPESTPASLPPELAPVGVGGVGWRTPDGRLSIADLHNDGGGSRPFVLFNPMPWDRDELVEVYVWDNKAQGQSPVWDQSFQVRSSGGELRAPQKVGQGDSWGHQYVRLAFPAKVPALGYATYAVEPCDTPAAAPEASVASLEPRHHCHYVSVERAPWGIENDLLKLTLDPRTGAIASLFDKRSGLELMQQDADVSGLRYELERPHGMSSWLIEHAGPSLGCELVELKTVERGPYRARVEARFRIHASEFRLSYGLCQGDPQVQLLLEGTWFERGTPQTGVPSLRIAFPFAFTEPKVRYEIPFAALDPGYPAGVEFPALEWVEVSGALGKQHAGCLLLNDSKHGHSFDRGTLWLSLIRASYDPDPLPEIGTHSVELRLQPFSGQISATAATRAARRLNRPVRVVGTSAHEGDLPSSGQFVNVDATTAVVAAVKKAERTAGLVIRVCEPNGAATKAKLTFAPWLGKPTRIAEVDLQENELEGGGARLDGDTATLTLERYGMVTILVEFAR